MNRLKFVALTRRLFPILFAIMMGLGPLAALAHAQLLGGGAGIPEPGGQYPSQTYYNALQIYRDGDLENALRGFESAMRGTRTDPSGKWLDSIPVRAMLAECYWHLGHLPACRTQIDEAIKVAIRNRGWLSQLDFTVLNTAGVATANPTNLWPEANSVRRLPVPRRMPLMSGRVVTEQSIAAGGVIETPNIKNIDAIEVMRGLAIISHRRRVLLGPLANQETLGAELLEATRVPSQLPSPIAKPLLYSMRAAEYFGITEDKTVIDRASKYATVGGAVHPITPLLLLCGIKSGAMGDDRGTLSREASGRLIATAQQITNAAAAIEQFEWIGESLQVAVGVASIEQLAVVENTAVLAARTLVRQSRLASLHCYLVAADAAISMNNVELAQRHLQAATTIASRRDVQWPRLEAYGAYIGARIAAATGQPIGYPGAGDMSAALSAMSDFILDRRDRKRRVTSMPWMYQTEIAIGAIGRGMGNQTAKNMLAAYSGPVPMVLWRHDPLNAMAAVYSNDVEMHKALLSFAAMENNGPNVLRETDRLLAIRLTEKCPLQGRLLQLRTLASSRAEDLWPSAKESLTGGGDGLKKLREQTQATLIMPQQAVVEDAGVGVATAMAANVSVRSQSQAQSMEAAVSALALSRLAVPEINPPRVAKEDLVRMPPETSLITFAIVAGRVLATATRDGATQTWTIPAAQRLPAMINRLLQDIGASKSRGKRIADEPEWQNAAAKLSSFLFPASSGFTIDGLRKVVIVPDGPLWYVPFELLPQDSAMATTTGSDVALWRDQVSVQYAPTPGFAFRDVASATTADRVAMITSLFFDPRNHDRNELIVGEVLGNVDSPLKATPAEAPPTDRLGLEVGHLQVAAALTPNLKDPMSTQIVPVDNSAGRASGKADWDRLRDWIRFPAGGPKTVVLAGLRTTASTTKLGDGGELFFPMAALRASGVREVMLSRWATGGRSAATLLTEIVGEVPHTTLAEALGRGTMMLQATELSRTSEPLLGKADQEVAEVSGGHPLFWATYLGGDSFHLPPPESED